MENKSKFGDLKNNDGFKSYNHISEECYKIYRLYFTGEFMHKLPPEQQFLFRFLYVAESTSFSIRLLISQLQTMPALALTRVRIEQMIVFSYLIHEDIKLGLLPFVKHDPIPFLEKDVLTMPEIAKELTKEYPIDEEDIKEKTKKYNRKWTELDLLSLAKKRDKLAHGINKISDSKLENSYIVYKVLSSVVHYDSNSLFKNFLNYYQVPSTKKILFTANPHWVFTALSILSDCDIVQTFEFLNHFEFDVIDKFLDLNQEWSKINEKYVHRNCD